MHDESEIITIELCRGDGFKYDVWLDGTRHQVNTAAEAGLVVAGFLSTYTPPHIEPRTTPLSPAEKAIIQMLMDPAQDPWLNLLKANPSQS